MINKLKKSREKYPKGTCWTPTSRRGPKFGSPHLFQVFGKRGGNAHKGSLKRNAHSEATTNYWQYDILVSKSNQVPKLK